MVVAAMSASVAEENLPKPPPPEVLSIEALVKEALERNPELKFYEAEWLAAKAERKSATQWRNPEISGSVGHKTVRGGGASAEGMAWSASVMQPFEWPGRIGLRKAIANREIELAELGLTRFKAALAGRVRTLACGLFAAQERAEAAGEVAERFKALREVLVQRDPAGLTPLLETRVIEATELNARREASEALLAMNAALFELNQLRGAAPDRPLKVIRPRLKFRPAQSIAMLQALARTNNFELRIRAVELAQQGFRVDLAQSERFPSISAGPIFSEENAGERERVIGLGVSFPLPLWNRNSGNIDAAKARQLQAEVSLNLVEREIQRKVAEAALAYETRLRQMKMTRPDAIEHFKDAAELADRHYRLGAVPVSTYVELQKQYLDAVTSLLETKRDLLETALNLELLTGLTPPLATEQEDAE